MRIRTIKPAFFMHDGLAEQPALARLLFIGLWCAADREGRLDDNPRRLKAQILPYDDADVDEMLDGLERGGFIARYEADGRRLIAIHGFARHQVVSPREPASELPAIPTGYKKALSKQCLSTVEALPEHCLDNAEAMLGLAGREGKGREQEGKDLALVDARAVVPCSSTVKARPRETWLTPWLDAWREAVGGNLPPGRAAKALGGIRAEADALDAWREYLSRTEARFASPEAFAARWRAFVPGTVDLRADDLATHNARAAAAGLALYRRQKAERGGVA